MSDNNEPKEEEEKKTETQYLVERNFQFKIGLKFSRALQGN